MVKRTNSWYAEQALDYAAEANDVGDYENRERHLNIARKAMATTGLGYGTVGAFLDARGYSRYRASRNQVKLDESLCRLNDALDGIALTSSSTRVVYIGDHSDTPWFSLRFIPPKRRGVTTPSVTHRLYTSGTDRTVAVFLDAPEVIAQSANVPEAYSEDKTVISLGTFALMVDMSRRVVDQPVSLYVPTIIAGKRDVLRWAGAAAELPSLEPESKFAQQITELPHQAWPVVTRAS